MELKDADFEKFSEWNEKSIRKEWESAQYGITESERKNVYLDMMALNLHRERMVLHLNALNWEKTIWIV